MKRNELIISITMLTMAAMFAGIYLMGCGSEMDRSDYGNLTLRVSDSPVDMANRVVVIFNGVDIKPAGGNSVRYIFNEDKVIDLLALTGGESEVILNSVALEPGQYNWIRLHVRALRGVLDSFIELDDLSVESLYVPSGDETGLKMVNTFIVPAGGNADFTVDFDLRKSVHNPEGYPDYILRPTLRIVDNTRVGSIAGIVNSSLLDAGGGNAVYVFSGPGVSPNDEGSANPPLTTTIVNATTGQYHVGFLTEGTYTVAFTDEADLDDPLTDNAISFHPAANVSVTEGATTKHDIN